MKNIQDKIKEINTLSDSLVTSKGDYRKIIKSIANTDISFNSYKFSCSEETAKKIKNYLRSDIQIKITETEKQLKELIK